MYVWEARDESRFVVKSNSKSQHGSHAVHDTETGKKVQSFTNRDEAHQLAKDLERGCR